MLVPADLPTAQIECAKEILRYRFSIALFRSSIVISRQIALIVGLHGMLLSRFEAMDLRKLVTIAKRLWRIERALMTFSDSGT